jgi:hypothetical protein
MVHVARIIELHSVHAALMASFSAAGYPDPGASTFQIAQAISGRSCRATAHLTAPLT